MLHLVARSKRARFTERFIDALRSLEGAYAFVGLTNKKLVGARDPLGIRPLVLGELDGHPILTSETCALDIIGARHVRDIEPGEVIVFSSDKVETLRPFGSVPPRPCIFEYIYFARPDSVVGGRSVYQVRKTMGMQLAAEAPATRISWCRCRIPACRRRSAIPRRRACPMSSASSATTMSARTFIQPTQSVRDQGVRMKHSANRAVVEGKRIVLIDDSLVRGTTSVKIVRMMREAGAREVHFRISSPPITHPDYYGIDTPDRDKLLAATHDLEGMRRYIGADSLAFLSIDGIYKSMGYEGRDPLRPQFTDHCFTGEYPTPLSDRDGEVAPRQLSLLAEAS